MIVCKPEVIRLSVQSPIRTCVEGLGFPHDFDTPLLRVVVFSANST